VMDYPKLLSYNDDEKPNNKDMLRERRANNGRHFISSIFV